jgi:hypothetical protein
MFPADIGDRSQRGANYPENKGEQKGFVLAAFRVITPSAVS